jgi:signal transduction histidine kinase
MRSLFSKILLWSFATLALSFIAFVAISYSITSRLFLEQDLVGSLTRMQAYGALDAYRQGGASRLQSYLALLNQYLQLRAEYHLVDDRGYDLLTGGNEAALLDEGRLSRRFLVPFRTRLVIATPLPDRRFTFIMITRPPVRFVDFLPYYLLVVLAVGVFSYFLTTHIVTPIQSLSRTVERFGSGDLSSRFHPQRQDEIGALGHAFDDMAGRIESLVHSQSQLLQDVSHELRSPLARLSFALELIRTPETREQALAQGRREIDRLASLIEAPLQVSRGESDKSRLNLCGLALRELIQEIVERCAIEANAQECSISLSCADVGVLGDRDVLDRAIENVLRNAIRHSPAAGIVEISLSASDDMALLSIRDHGPGVPEEALDDIFQPFHRLESAAGGGVGLGLSITRRAIALHNGTIRAGNASPGLQITIELPRAGGYIQEQ